MVEELLLGDNPFIGVSHLSQTKAREESSLGNKVEVIEAAVNGGATGFTFSTDVSNLELLSYLKMNREDLLSVMNYYILFPYAQSYVRRANVGGTPRLLRSVLKSMLVKRSAIPEALAALGSWKLERLVGLHVKAELAPYLDVLPRGRVKAVLIHEIVTDVLSAFGLVDMFVFLNDYLRRMGLDLGLHTKNFGQLHKAGVFAHTCPKYVMTSVNSLGYMMAPTKETVEEILEDFGGKTRVIAINILASGALDLKDAMNYLTKYKNDLYAVTSASMRPSRIYENFRELSRTLL